MTETGHRPAGFSGRLPAAVGWALLGLGLWSTLRGLGRPVGAYDEGILLTDAYLVSLGEVPYRDFYSNYPPGAFLAIAALWKVFGTSVGVERALGVMAHLVVALAAGWVAGLMRGTRFSAPAAGVVLVWLARLGAPAYAWLPALASAVLACGLVLRASDRPSRGAWLAAGAAVGTVGCLRHDLFVYFAAGLATLAGAWALGVRRLAMTHAERTSLAWLGLGAAVPLVLLWLPTLALAGVRPVIEDSYFTQVQHVMPARILPMPELSPLVSLPPLPFPLPAFSARGYEGAVALTLIGPALALLTLVLAPRLGLASRLGPALLLALSIAVIPQMAGRSDPYHAFLTTTPALLLLCVLLESCGGRVGYARAIFVAGSIAVLGVPVSMQLEIPDPPAPATWQQAHPRYGAVPEPEPARQAVLEFIAANTNPGEPIFVGLVDHSRVFVSEMDIYFFADRPGATRIMQFDPNVVNREDVQREMVAEMEAQQTRVAVLSSRYPVMNEPNESARAGASLLDEYLSAEFVVAARAGPYQLLRRRD